MVRGRGRGRARGTTGERNFLFVWAFLRSVCVFRTAFFFLARLEIRAIRSPASNFRVSHRSSAVRVRTAARDDGGVPGQSQYCRLASFKIAFLAAVSRIIFGGEGWRRDALGTARLKRTDLAELRTAEDD